MSIAVLAVIFAVPAFASGAKDATGGGNPPVGADTPVEWVIGQTPGGGHDFNLRQIEKAIRANNIMSNPVLYTYKPGGGTAVAMQYTKTQTGRSDLIMATAGQLINVPLMMDVGVKREDLTDIALYGTQYLFFWVMKDRAEKEGWKTLDDVLKSGKPISFTASGVGSGEEIVVSILRTMVPNADFRTVMLGDAEAMTQLLGGHVDVFVNELSGGGLEGYRETGDVIALACAGPKRSSYISDVPTLMDLGYDFSYVSFSGVIGPPNMSKEAVAWWQDIMKKTYDTKEFKELQQIKGLEPVFLVNDDMKKFLDDFKRDQIARFTKIGIKMVPNP